MTDTNGDPLPEDRLPIVEETVSIEKRVVETERVRVRTVVDEEDVLLRASLERGFVEVERVAIGREVDAAPPVREEEGVLVVPVIEERLVVEKRLFLVEEIRLHRTSATIPVEVPTTRRVMRAEVERSAGSGTNGGE